MGTSRRFVDSEGVTWQVYELTAGDGQSGAADAPPGWLYFFSRDATRSLTPFPDDWERLDWPGLERLCRRAAPPSRSGSSSPARASARARADASV